MYSTTMPLLSPALSGALGRRTRRTALDRLRRLLRLVVAAQVLDQVGHVCDLLLEIALVGLQPCQELLAVREEAVETQPPFLPVMVPVPVHQLTSFPCSVRPRTAPMHRWRSPSAPAQA